MYEKETSGGSSTAIDFEMLGHSADTQFKIMYHTLSEISELLQTPDLTDLNIKLTQVRKIAMY